MENNINSVIENNKIINDFIQKMIAERRKLGVSFEKEQDGKIALDQQVEAIFKNLTNLCLEIYALEFPEYECQGKKEVNFVPQKRGTGDCYGGKKGLQITTGMQEFIEGTVRKQLPYIVKNIEEYATKIITDKEINNYVGSTLDQLDYFVLLFNENGIDMDWVIDLLPHEAMHTFGVDKGNKFLKEGITEELTREICQKYQVHMTPTSHTQEAEFVRKLETVVGRDEIIKAGMTGNYEIISESFDKNLELQEGSFNIYSEILKNIYSLTTDKKTNLKFYRDVYNLSFKEISEKYNLSNNDNFKALKIKCEELAKLNGKEIVSFDDLMQPINKVYQLSQNKVNADINSDDIDYSNVLEMQRNIMQELGIVQEIPIETKKEPEGKLGLKDAEGGGIRRGEVIETTNALNNAIRNQENELNQENTNEQGDRD